MSDHYHPLIFLCVRVLSSAVMNLNQLPNMVAIKVYIDRRFIGNDGLVYQVLIHWLDGK